MSFNFQKSRKPRPLFIPLNTFSFASFVVPMKFRQPVVAKAIVAPCETRFLRRHANSTRAHL